MILSAHKSAWSVSGGGLPYRWYTWHRTTETFVLVCTFHNPIGKRWIWSNLRRLTFYMVCAWRVPVLGVGWVRLLDATASSRGTSSACAVIVTVKYSPIINGAVSQTHSQTTRRHPRDVGRVLSEWVVISTIVGGGWWPGQWRLGSWDSWSSSFVWSSSLIKGFVSRYKLTNKTVVSKIILC